MPQSRVVAVVAVVAVRSPLPVMCKTWKIEKFYSSLVLPDKHDIWDKLDEIGKRAGQVEKSTK